MKKKKKNDSECIRNMENKINKFKNNVWLPNLDIKYNNKVNNTWFNIYESKRDKNQNTNLIIKNDKLKKIKYNSIKVNLFLENNQKKIINNWIESFRKMYNETLYYIKNNHKNKGFSYNWLKIRDILKQKKNIISSNCTIKIHELDFAIKLACSNYKSCLTNCKKKNIKHFRIRYWGYNKENKLLKLEKTSFNNNTIRETILGDIDASYNSEMYNLSEVKTDCELHFSNRDNRYFLYVPQKINSKIKYNKRNEYISCDPGIRTFMTCISENKAIKICDNNKKIKDYLKKKDKILGNENIPKRIKTKNERIINKKLENLKNELHWKTINYMTKNYKHILIGNMSKKYFIKSYKILSRFNIEY
mgnify:CR=1 FL=1